MYLTVFTRLDYCFVVNQLARFMSNPDPSHVAAARRVLRYLVGTRSLGITYRRSGQDAVVTSVGGHVSSNTITASTDADHAGAKDRRSVSGWALILNGAVVTWSSKRQSVTAIASTDSEFYSVDISVYPGLCVSETHHGNVGVQANLSHTYLSGQQCMYLSGQGIWHVQQGETHRYSCLSDQGVVGVR
jgi:hypothetical protein